MEVIRSQGNQVPSNLKTIHRSIKDSKRFPILEDPLEKNVDGEIRILTATDLASRGLDIKHVGRVINYHMPKQIDAYLHRAGRTARAGRKDLVVNFVEDRDLEFVRKLESLEAPPSARRG